MSHHDEHDSHNDEPVLHGLLAEYKDPSALVKGAKKIRDAGFTNWDAHSPFPVHGLDPAMGIKPTILPWVVLAAGLSGLGLALLMQWWMNAHDYPWIISGKPFFSLPANIPVIFESTVLLAGLTAFGAMMVLNLLPEHYSPLFKNERFKRATDDGFFISIEAKDPRFDLHKTEVLLRDSGASVVEKVMDEPKQASKLPRGIIWAGAVVTCLTFIPLGFVARARYTTTRETRVHLISDMDAQPKYKAQAYSPFFADHRASRPPVEGTVAFGEMNDDDHFYRGKAGEAFAADFPEQVTVDQKTMARGQERFGIYCAPCHGLAGGGDGPVARRAGELQEGTWVPPTSLHAQHVRAQPPGQIFNTITNGVRNMPAYGPQIAPADRWAIVLYVKALERSQFAQLTDVPENVQQTLR